MRNVTSVILIVVSLLMAGCLETLPRSGPIDGIPALPTLKERNAAVAEAWDRSSLDCRSQHKPRGGFCEQLKTEGEFLACSSERFAKAASALRYPAIDKIWVWHNCVATTANLLRDGFYLTRSQIDRRVANCQARIDLESEFPVRQSGFFAPFLAMVTTGDKAGVPAVLPSDFGLQESQVALPTCSARFPPQAEARPEPRGLAVMLPPPAPALPTPPPQIIQVVVEAPPPPVVVAPEESKKVVPDESKKEPAKVAVKPRARNAVSASDVKSTAGAAPGLRAPTTPSNPSTVPLMTGACPIPGACGPTVPADAVGKR
jgi:hypothetical protein